MVAKKQSLNETRQLSIDFSTRSASLHNWLEHKEGAVVLFRLLNELEIYNNLLKSCNSSLRLVQGFGQDYNRALEGTRASFLHCLFIILVI